jgi:HD-GYP domain-containing protein (c-di-GMP phosphodiesterase class II)
MPSNILHICLNNLLSALSMALDLAQNRSYEHSRRTAYIALRLAQQMKLAYSTQVDIYFASLLHDIGMTGKLSKYNIHDFHQKESLKKLHSDNGYEIAKKLPFGKRIEKYILYHHEHWDGTGVHHLKGKEIPLGAHIIHIADTFDIVYDRQSGTFTARELIMDFINKNKGKRLHPDLVEKLFRLSKTEKFWMDLQQNNIQHVLTDIEPIQITSLSIEDLERIAEAFAVLIDGKSPFTYLHSQGVATLSQDMAKIIGYDELKCRKIGIAGYLHDLGKLAIPNEILDKPGKLSNEEYLKIKAHPYYTKLILGQVEGCKDIASWAGNHHEKLDGSGYPECLDASTLHEEDQIIAIADIYKALTESRPYRDGLKKQEAFSIIAEMTKKQKISKKMLDCLEAIL